MADIHSPLTSNPATLTKEQINLWANNPALRMKNWQALPLILLPKALLTRPRPLRVQSPIVQQQLQEWFATAVLDDIRLGIERHWIPYIEIYIPDTLAGRQFHQVASAIGQIPLEANIIPKNPNQAYWLKISHYFYQVRGLLLAQQLYPLDPNPLHDGDQHLLQNNLFDGEFERVEHFVDVSHKEIQLIAAAFDDLRDRLPELAEQHSFDDHFQFFVKMQTERFKEDWEYTVNNRDRLQPRTMHEEQDEIATIAPLLDQSPWLDKEPSSTDKAKTKRRIQRKPYKIQVEEQTLYFEQQGLYGHLILALQALEQRKLDSEWSTYIQAIRQAKSAYSESMFWLKGKPQYRCQPSVNQLDPETEQPSQRSTWKPIQGAVSPHGYLIWQFA